MQDDKIRAAKKVFKIDVLSKSLHLKRSTIREWEKRFKLRENFLTGPDKLYTVKDAELFRTIRWFKMDKQQSDEFIMAHLEKMSPAKEISTTVKLKTRPKVNNKAIEPKPLEVQKANLDCFVGFKLKSPITEEKKVVQKIKHIKHKEPKVQVKSTSSKMISISKQDLVEIKNKLLALKKQLSQPAKTAKKRQQEIIL
ncbi:MerR family transcriptional regulator [Candidatus Dependentiae bacterium]